MEGAHVNDNVFEFSPTQEEGTPGEGDPAENYSTAKSSSSLFSGIESILSGGHISVGAVKKNSVKIKSMVSNVSNRVSTLNEKTAQGFASLSSMMG